MHLRPTSKLRYLSIKNIKLLIPDKDFFKLNRDAGGSEHLLDTGTELGAYAIARHQSYRLLPLRPRHGLRYRLQKPQAGRRCI